MKKLFIALYMYYANAENHGIPYFSACLLLGGAIAVYVFALLEFLGANLTANTNGNYAIVLLLSIMVAPHVIMPRVVSVKQIKDQELNGDEYHTYIYWFWFLFPLGIVLFLLTGKYQLTSLLS
ncbi:hypothetical protein [Hymenobacter sp. B81]|uniref:hypothetical protein n=1 Tax=Hymenobacter sp. B81 TaxID=3344878 RepID=UPI0037DC6A82